MHEYIRVTQGFLECNDRRYRTCQINIDVAWHQNNAAQVFRPGRRSVSFNAKLSRLAAHWKHLFKAFWYKVCLQGSHCIYGHKRLSRHAERIGRLQLMQLCSSKQSDYVHLGKLKG